MRRFRAVLVAVMVSFTQLFTMNVIPVCATEMPKIVGYLNATTLDGGLGIPLSQINLELCNAIIYAQFTVKSASDPTLVQPFGIPNHYLTDSVTAAHAKGIPIEVSIGGTNNLTSVMSDEILRYELARNIANLVVTYNCDGADIDWEEAWFSGSHQPYMDSLVSTLYDFLHPLGKTISVFSSWELTKYEVSLPIFAKVDWVILSSYYGDLAYVQNFLNSWSNAGYPKNKILAGVAFEGFDSNNAGCASWSNIVDVLDPPVDQNSIAMNTIMPGLYPPTTTISGGVLKWCSPDRLSSIVDYVKANGYGGIGVWELGLDKLQDTRSLLKLIYDRITQGISLGASYMGQNSTSTQASPNVTIIPKLRVKRFGKRWFIRP